MVLFAGKARIAKVAVVAGLVMLGAMYPAFGSQMSYSGASGALSADALFDLSGTTLTVTLTNTSASDTLVPADVLTGLFFSLTGGASLSTVSAVLGSGSSVVYWDAVGGDAAADQAGPTTGTYGGDVGAEWAYVAGQGISSSGLGLFGPGDRFDTTRNLYGPASPDGVQYGIVSEGDNVATGNTGVTGSPLIDNSVVFTFMASAGFSLDDIAGVSFQYGTDLAEPNIPGDPVPEPATLALLGMGLAGMAAARIRKRA